MLSGKTFTKDIFYGDIGLIREFSRKEASINASECFNPAVSVTLVHNNRADTLLCNVRLPHQNDSGIAYSFR